MSTSSCPALRGQRQCDHHLIDSMPGDHVLQLIGGPQDRNPLNIASLSAGIIVEETHDREAKLLVSIEPLDNLPAEITGTDNQYPLQVAAGTADAGEPGGYAPPEQADEGCVGDREDRQKEPRVSEIGRSVECQPRGEEDGGEHHRQHHPHPLFEAGAHPSAVVQTLEVEHHGVQHQHNRQQPKVHGKRWHALCDRLDLDHKP